MNQKVLTAVINHPLVCIRHCVLLGASASYLVRKIRLAHYVDHARIQKVMSGGSNCEFFFLIDEGREDPNTTLSGPSSALQRNAIKWRFAGVLVMAQH